VASWQSLGEGSSITEHYRAIDLFTDRAALIRRYAAYLNEEPTPGRIADLANNNSASAQVWVIEALPFRPPPVPPSCKQHPSGEAAAPAA